VHKGDARPAKASPPSGCKAGKAAVIAKASAISPPPVTSRRRQITGVDHRRPETRYRRGIALRLVVSITAAAHGPGPPTKYCCDSKVATSGPCVPEVTRVFGRSVRYAGRFPFSVGCWRPGANWQAVRSGPVLPVPGEWQRSGQSAPETDDQPDNQRPYGTAGKPSYGQTSLKAPPHAGIIGTNSPAGISVACKVPTRRTQAIPSTASSPRLPRAGPFAGSASLGRGKFRPHAFVALARTLHR